jgi:hypothetical protein
MEEIVLKAKMGPPVTKIVGGDIVVEKSLQGASLLERHKGANRRIRGKQGLANVVTEQRIREATEATKSKTKQEAAVHLRTSVDGLVRMANEMGEKLAKKNKGEVDDLTGHISNITRELKGTLKTAKMQRRKINRMTEGRKG